MDRLEAIGFIDRIGADKVHLSTYAAWRALGCERGATAPV